MDSKAVSTPAPTITFTTNPTAKSLTVGDALSLTAAATASDGSAVSYQWFKDGNALTGRTGASLSISSVALTDAGSYKVKATAGSASKDSAAATVEVVAAMVLNAPATAAKSTTAGTLITATWTGGKAPYTAKATQGSEIFNDEEVDKTDASISVGADNTKLVAGDLTWTITDALGKTLTGKTTITAAP